MDMGSGSVTEADGSSAESLGGFKVGQKIYFENVGGGPGAGSSSGSGRRGRGGGPVQGSQPPRCQVEGCRVDLSDAKTYYSRHKVCGAHSKSSKVIVAGTEQRFCQQCSRFHQLSEFDQGKRSCRRRLAGHNERRRKPQSGSLLSTRYGRLHPSTFGRSGLLGGFVVDPMSWPMARPSEYMPGTAGRPPTSNLWLNNADDPPSGFLGQSSLGRSGFASPGHNPEESIRRVTESSRALSLLSNQQLWGPTNPRAVAPIFRPNDLTCAEDPAVAHPCHNYPWAFKGRGDTSAGSLDISPLLGLSQISQPVNGDMAASVELSHPEARRHFMQQSEHSRAFDSSTQHVNWSP